MSQVNLTIDGRVSLCETFYNANLWLGVGDLTGYSGTAWTPGQTDIPGFDVTSTSLVNLLGMRKPTTVSYVTQVNGVAEIFTIEDIFTDSFEGGNEYFRMISPTTEYIVWFDSTGSDEDPASPGQQSVRVPLSGNPVVNLTEVLNNLVEFAAIEDNGVITVTCNVAGAMYVYDHNTNFTFTVVQEGITAGEISYGGKSWNTSENPTNYLYLHFILDPSDIPTSTIYQLGLFSNAQIGPNVPLGKMFLSLSDLTSYGTLMAGKNCDPIIRSSMKRNIISFVLTF